MIRSKHIKKSEGYIEVIGPFSEQDELFITTDSRRLEGKNTFIALYGEKFDGFNFIENLLQKSSLTHFIFEEKEGRKEQSKKWQEEFPKVSFILVENIYSYILSLAHSGVQEFKEKGGKVVGLTGSNGKTTNKEMLAQLLSSAIGSEKVHYTKGNLNNHIGVPLTIFDLEQEHDVAIVEMGTNHPGEIKVLCDTATPDYGMITNIGYAHIEYLKSLDGVLEEKSALYRSIEKSKYKDKIFVLNGFDEKLKTLMVESWVSVVDDSTVKLSENSFEINWNGQTYKISNPSLLGRHQQINMAMGITMALGIYPTAVDKIVEAAQTFRLKGMNRGEIREYGQMKFYLDAYNANPSSMIASLSSFSALLQEKKISKDKVLLVLGDMNEIGDQAEQLHRETALKANEMGFKYFAFVGRYAEFYREGFAEGKPFEDAAHLSLEFKNCITGLDFVFIKGSRSLQLESILDIYKD